MKRLAVVSAILCMLAMASARVTDAGSAADPMVRCAPETTNATDRIEKETVGGQVIIGHEVRSFEPCGRKDVLWLMGKSPAFEAIITAYRRERPGGDAYRPLLMVLTGKWVNPPADGFGADYDAAFLATLLVRVVPRGRCMGDGQATDASLSVKQKITFDISMLDEDGRYGPPGGKRALSYEFCIPDTARNKAEVERITWTDRMRER